MAEEKIAELRRRKTLKSPSYGRRGLNFGIRAKLRVRFLDKGMGLIDASGERACWRVRQQHHEQISPGAEELEALRALSVSASPRLPVKVSKPYRFLERRPTTP